MPIQSGDVKLLKSAVMADVPEGGGAPTGNTIAAFNEVIQRELAVLPKKALELGLKLD